jgi:uncharacterized protein (DUF305 family)
MWNRYLLSAGLSAIIVIMSNCTSDSGSPGPQPETSSVPKNPPMDTGANAVNNNSNDQSVSGNLPYSLKSAMSSMMNEMKEVHLTDNFDVDFANLMALHHKGAIAMSQLELDGGKDSTMKNMATKIKNTQQQQVNELKRFINNTQGNDNKQGKGVLQKTMNGMNSNMDTLQAGNNLDSSFATLMKAHHKQGIEMAKQELANGKNPELKKLAQNIISDSEKEINQFDRWMNSK